MGEISHTSPGLSSCPSGLVLCVQPSYFRPIIFPTLSIYHHDFSSVLAKTLRTLTKSISASSIHKMPCLCPSLSSLAASPCPAPAQPPAQAPGRHFQQLTHKVMTLFPSALRAVVLGHVPTGYIFDSSNRSPLPTPPVMLSYPTAGSLSHPAQRCPLVGLFPEAALSCSTPWTLADAFLD